MESISHKNLFSSPEFTEKWILENCGKGIVIGLKKTEMNKKFMEAIQMNFAKNKKQGYAMYMNYLKCLKREKPEIKLVSAMKNQKGKLLILGFDMDSLQNDAMVISEDQILKKSNIRTMR